MKNLNSTNGFIIATNKIDKKFKQDLTEWKVENEDVKPNFEEVVTWV